ncbi:MAG: glycosyltransferase family 4 protein [Limnohabitans sp.]
MKILHIEAGRHLYGGARQVQYILQGLHARGVTNVLACPPGAHIAQAAHAWAQVVEMPMRGDLDVGLVWRLLRLIRSTQADLVHVHSRRGADVWGPLAARLAGIPCVISRRVDNAEKPWIARFKYRHVQRIITISEGIRAVMLAQGLPPQQVVCVRSALDPSPYLQPYDKAAFRHSLGVAEDTLLVGMVAQLIERKGHRHLLAALPSVLKDFPNLQVLIYGRGPLEAELRQEIDQRGLGPHVRMMGFKDDLPQTLGCLDLLVHPADMEGLGIALLQASAAQLPIIACRAGGMPEAVRDGVNGLLISPGDVSGLASAMQALLADPAMRSRMGKAGRELILHEFSTDTMCDGNLAVYREVLGT